MSPSNLRKLSNRTLLSRLTALVRREHESTLAILLHLNEVERRKLHLELGYPSLFRYCTDRLGYSESSAGRRIQTARIVRRYPQIFVLLEKREVSVTTVSRVAGTVFERDDPSLVNRIRGKTQREVDAIVAEYRPRERARDRIRPVRVTRDPEAVEDMTSKPALVRCTAGASAQEAAVSTGGFSSGTPVSADGRSKAAPTGDAHSHCGSVTTARNGAGGEKSTTVASGDGDAVDGAVAYKIQFVAGRRLVEALDRVRSLLSFRIPSRDPMETMLTVVVEEYLDRHCPRRRHARREARGGRRGSHTATADPPAGQSPEPATPGGSRRIPLAIRDRQLAGAEYRCSYIGTDGVRCSERRGLQIDHIRPVALGGSNDPGNLRVLCPAHNRLEAERLLGGAVMRPYVR